MSIEKTLRSIITTHRSKLELYREDKNFKKLDKDVLIENYLTNSVRLPNGSDVIGWCITELINQPNDILLVPSQDVLNALRDFKNDIYKDVSESIFKSLIERVVVSGTDLETVYNKNNYKVIVMDYVNTRFRIKLSKYIAKNYSKVDLVLGIN